MHPHERCHSSHFLVPLAQQRLRRASQAQNSVYCEGYHRRHPHYSRRCLRYHVVHCQQCWRSVFNRHACAWTAKLICLFSRHRVVHRLRLHLLPTHLLVRPAYGQGCAPRPVLAQAPHRHGAARRADIRGDRGARGQPAPKRRVRPARECLPRRLQRRPLCAQYDDERYHGHR